MPNFSQQMYEANAALPNAAALQAQADLANMQAAALRQQMQAQRDEQDNQQRQASERIVAESRARSAENRAIELREDAERAAKSQHDIDAERLRLQVRDAITGDSVSRLKAKAATLEAVMRSTPSDSAAFHDAFGALGAVNAELATRNALPAKRPIPTH